MKFNFEGKMKMRMREMQYSAQTPNGCGIISWNIFMFGVTSLVMLFDQNIMEE